MNTSATTCSAILDAGFANLSALPCLPSIPCTPPLPTPPPRLLFFTIAQATGDEAATLPQWMKERGLFVKFIYSFYVNYDDCSTAYSSKFFYLRYFVGLVFCNLAFHLYEFSA